MKSIIFYRHATRGQREKNSLPFFENQKKCTDFGKKKGPDSIILSLNLPFKMKFWEYLGEKTPLRSLFFFNFWQNVYWSALISRNLPCPEKFLVARLFYYIIIFYYVTIFKSLYFTITRFCFIQFFILRLVRLNL